LSGTVNLQTGRKMSSHSLVLSLSVLAVICVFPGVRTFAQDTSVNRGRQVFCRLEALPLRQNPSDGAAFAESVATFKEKLLALRQWKDWILVRTCPPVKPCEGWVKQWHLSSRVARESVPLPDLRRILIREGQDGERSVSVGGDVYCRLPIALSREKGELKAQLAAQKCVLLSECRHYFFDLRVKRALTFVLQREERLTPENMAIYEIRKGKCIKTASVVEPFFLEGRIPQDKPDAYEPPRGISLRCHDHIIGTDEAYGFLWLKEVCLARWFGEPKQLQADRKLTVNFGAKLLAVAEIPSYMKIVDAESGKSGWIESVLLCRQKRLSRLRDEGLVPEFLTIVADGPKQAEPTCRTLPAPRVGEAPSTFAFDPGDCVMFESKEAIIKLRENGKLPKGLRDVRPKEIYLFTKAVQFEVLP